MRFMLYIIVGAEKKLLWWAKKFNTRIAKRILSKIAKKDIFWHTFSLSFFFFLQNQQISHHAGSYESLIQERKPLQALQDSVSEFVPATPCFQTIFKIDESAKKPCKPNVKSKEITSNGKVTKRNHKCPYDGKYKYSS